MTVRPFTSAAGIRLLVMFGVLAVCGRHAQTLAARPGNDAGSAVSGHAQLSPVTAPALISQSQPTNRTVHYQSSVALSVEATVQGQAKGFPLACQWQFNGTNIGGATTNAYAFVAAAGSEGTYSVVVTNAAGSIRAAWQLTVLYDTLAYHLSTNAVGYARGRTDVSNATLVLSGWSYDRYSGTNLACLTNAVWSRNCWLAGVRGLSATCIGYSNGTGGTFLLSMVSPRHYLIARHVGWAR